MCDKKNEESDFEPENRTECPDSDNGQHDWEPDYQQEDWLCVLCSVWESDQ